MTGAGYRPEDWDGVQDAWAEQAAIEVAQAAADWRAKWPGHCKACGGWGGKAYTEMHGFRGGSGETMFDLCGARDVRFCHRCGCMGLNEEGEGPCTACGWNYDDGEPTL